MASPTTITHRSPLTVYERNILNLLLADDQSRRLFAAAASGIPSTIDGRRITLMYLLRKRGPFCARPLRPKDVLRFAVSLAEREQQPVEVRTAGNHRLLFRLPSPEEWAQRPLVRALAREWVQEGRSSRAN
jgi:hypothetical protein